MATTDVTTAAAAKFSPEMALYYAKEMSRNLDTINAVAAAAINAENAKNEPDINVELLFEAIENIASDAHAINALQDMLQAMIPAKVAEPA